MEKLLLLLKLVYCPVAKLKSATKFFRPSSRYRISIDAVNAVVRIDAFFVFVCRSVPKEGKIIIYFIKFVVSLSSLVTASDALGQYLLSHFYFCLISLTLRNKFIIDFCRV